MTTLAILFGLVVSFAAGFAAGDGHRTKIIANVLRERSELLREVGMLRRFASPNNGRMRAEEE